MYVLWALGLYCAYFFSKTKSTFYHWRQHLCSARRQQNWRKRKEMCSCRERTAAQDLAAHRGGGQLQRALPPSWGTAAIIERLQFSCSHDLLLRSIQGRPLETVSLRLGFAEIYLQKNALGFNKGGCKR